MSSKSIFWTTGTSGDGLSPYTQAELTDWLRRTFINNPATEGVIPNYGGEFAVTGSTSPITVASGAAMVYGFPFEMTVSSGIAIPTPSIGTTAHRVVFRADYSARTVRIALKSASDGVNVTPSLTQTPNTLWELPIASLSITTGGAITITDQRNYLHFNSRVATNNIDTSAVTTPKIADSNVTTAKIADSNVTTAKIADSNVTTAKVADSNITTAKIADGNVSTAKLANDSVDDTKVGNTVPAVIRRQGSSATNWQGAAGTNQTVGAVRIQLGNAIVNTSLLGGAATAITFNTAFSGTPLILAFPTSLHGAVQLSSITTGGFSMTAKDLAGADMNATVTWLAIGPE